MHMYAQMLILKGALDVAELGGQQIEMGISLVFNTLEVDYIESKLLYTAGITFYYIAMHQQLLLVRLVAANLARAISRPSNAIHFEHLHYSALFWCYIVRALLWGLLGSGVLSFGQCTTLSTLGSVLDRAVTFWVVCNIGRLLLQGGGAVEAAAVVWPAKELARGQFAGQAAYVGVGGFFQPQKCFWKCGKVVRKHFLLKSFDCNVTIGI